MMALAGPIGICENPDGPRWILANPNAIFAGHQVIGDLLVITLWIISSCHFVITNVIKVKIQRDHVILQFDNILNKAFQKSFF